MSASEVDWINGRRALVTGAGKRLGRALALALAENGAHVALHYRSAKDEAEITAKSIRDGGGKAVLVAGDLSEPETAERIFGEAQAELGGVDILINSASIFPSDQVMNLSWESLTHNMQINAYAPFVLSRSLAAQGNEGAVVNLLDTRMNDYDKEHASYHVSKRMLHTFTCLTAEAFAPKVRVNAIAPGLVLPPVDKDEDYLEGLKHTNPLQSYGSAADVVHAALYLLRAPFVTGQVIYVDGGRHLRGGLYA